MEMYQRSQTQTDVQSDPAAVALLQDAFERTSRWGKDFPGFTANICCNDNGKQTQGSVKIKSSKEVEVTLESPSPEDSLLKWAQSQLAMMAAHRGHRSFEAADGRYALTLGAEDHHPLGRQVLIHGDGMNSRYRVANSRIQQISRTMGPMRFTINIQDTMTTSDGKFLTTQYVVFYFTPEGKIDTVESFTDQPFELKGTYLPGSRRIISEDQGEATVRVLTFSDHRFL